MPSGTNLAAAVAAPPSNCTILTRDESAALCAIGAGHSRDMAEGRVAFGHDGFRTRMARMPGSVRAAAENVAMNHGSGDVAKTAVRGWIDSPGHRRNLLGTYTECGIGVHEHHGRFYLTQLFALR